MIQRPKDPNPLFKMVNESVVATPLTPLQRQRQKDGTPSTVGGRTSLRPPDTKLFLEGLSKSEEPVKKAERLDVEAIVKAYLAYTDGD